MVEWQRIADCLGPSGQGFGLFVRLAGLLFDIKDAMLNDFLLMRLRADEMLFGDDGCESVDENEPFALSFPALGTIFRI